MSFKDRETVIKEQLWIFKGLTGLDLKNSFNALFENIDERVAEMIKNGEGDKVNNYVRAHFQKFFNNVYHEIVQKGFDGGNLTSDAKKTLFEFRRFAEGFAKSNFPYIANGGEIDPTGLDFFDEKKIEAKLKRDINKTYSPIPEVVQNLKNRKAYNFSDMSSMLNVSLISFNDKMSGNDPLGARRLDEDIADICTSIRVMEHHYNNRFFLSRWFFGGSERQMIRTAKERLTAYAESTGKTVEDFIDENMSPSNDGQQVTRAFDNEPISNLDLSKDLNLIDEFQKEYVLVQIRLETFNKYKVTLDKDFGKELDLKQLVGIYNICLGKNLKISNITLNAASLSDFKDTFERRPPDIKSEDEVDAELKNFDKALVDVLRKKVNSFLQPYFKVCLMNLQQKKEMYQKKTGQEYKFVEFEKNDKILTDFYIQTEKAKGVSEEEAKKTVENMSYEAKRMHYENVKDKKFSRADYLKDINKDVKENEKEDVQKDFSSKMEDSFEEEYSFDSSYEQSEEPNKLNQIDVANEELDELNQIDATNKQ